MKFIKKFIEPSAAEETDENLHKKVISQAIESEQWLTWQKKLSDNYGIERGGSKKQQEPKIRPLRKWLLATAAAVLLLVSSILALKNFTSASPAKLADSYISTEKFPHPLELRSKGLEEDLGELRNQAALAYIKSDYSTAISLGEQIIQQAAETTTDDHFFLGLSYLYSHQLPLAIDQLTRAREKGRLTGRFLPETEWFLALAYIKDQRIDPGIELLDQIIQNKQWMIGKAIKLKKAIQK